jgi:hypothetical protein
MKEYIACYELDKSGQKILDSKEYIDLNFDDLNPLTEEEEKYILNNPNEIKSFMIDSSDIIKD